jgi:hypothetical protein
MPVTRKVPAHSAAGGRFGVFCAENHLIHDTFQTIDLIHRLDPTAPRRGKCPIGPHFEHLQRLALEQNLESWRPHCC